MELNTIEQWAKAYLHTPTSIDFAEFVEAAASANFPTTAIELEIRGTVQATDGGLSFAVEGTDQSLPIEEGFLAPGESGRIHADVEDFGASPRLIHRLVAAPEEE